MMTTITLNIDENDLSLWYQLAAEYHKDRKKFFEKRQGNEEREENSIKSADPVKEETLYECITRSCTCGECYQALARADRIPWRSIDGNYVNSKHGIYTPPKHCTAPMHPRGYIYDKKARKNEPERKTDENWRRPSPVEFKPVQPAPQIVVKPPVPTPEKKIIPIVKPPVVKRLKTMKEVTDRATLLNIAQYIHQYPSNWPDAMHYLTNRTSVREHVLSSIGTKEAEFRSKFGVCGVEDYANAFFSSYRVPPYCTEDCDYAVFVFKMLASLKSGSTKSTN